MPLEHLPWGINHLSRNPVPELDHHHSEEIGLVTNDREKFMLCFSEFQSLLGKQPRDRYTACAKNNGLGALK